MKSVFNIVVLFQDAKSVKSKTPVKVKPTSDKEKECTKSPPSAEKRKENVEVMID